MKRRGFYRFTLAFFIALVVNGAGLLLVIQLNRYVKVPINRAKAAPETIYLQEPPKKKPERRVRSQRPKVRPRAVPLSIPDLPSSISSEAVMPNISDIDLLSDLVGQEQGFGTDLIFEEEQVDEPPKVIRKVAPDYPFAAENQGIEGFVLLKLYVSSSGRVESVWVTESEPVGVFENAAQKAARRYRFSPARFKGRAVAVYCRQKIVFKLQD
ncbi:MAG: energy transducer TonB [Deltaproteobacteria bacterium]|nr:energy transducer TonB [Deltaproteobacteria bacterium]